MSTSTTACFYLQFLRVTGLDPAGPLFERTTEEVRIDRSDCPFVDIIHTNGGNEDNGFLGINADVGHADYFPNGGHKQPKCNNNFYCAHIHGLKYLLVAPPNIIYKSAILKPN